MENILIRFAAWIFRKYGYWFVATKDEEKTIGDQELIYYTDTFHFHRMLKELKHGRF